MEPRDFLRDKFKEIEILKGKLITYPNQCSKDIIKEINAICDDVSKYIKVDKDVKKDKEYKKTAVYHDKKIINSLKEEMMKEETKSNYNSYLDNKEYKGKVKETCEEKKEKKCTEKVKETKDIKVKEVKKVIVDDKKNTNVIMKGKCCEEKVIEKPIKVVEKPIKVEKKCEDKKKEKLVCVKDEMDECDYDKVKKIIDHEIKDLHVNKCKEKKKDKKKKKHKKDYKICKAKKGCKAKKCCKKKG